MSADRKVYYPSKLLTRSNAKTIKGEKFGWDTNILYMSPHKQNEHGVNLCAFASKGCAAACLYTAGRGKFSNVQKGRINKTNLFITQRHWFLEKLIKELKLLMGPTNQCVRLNGTTDIPWENVKWNKTSIIEMFPNIQFYDYTKSVKRVLNNKFKNYHLTFSRSECNDEDCIKVLKAGHNVAAVFSNEFYKKNLANNKETQYKIQGESFKVIDGDVSDLRFLDNEQGVIVGLKAKGDANKDTSGFVLY